MRKWLARRLDPGHYIVAERKAKIVDKVFRLQQQCILQPQTVEPAVRDCVDWLTRVEV